MPTISASPSVRASPAGRPRHPARSAPMMVLAAAALWGTTGTAQVFGGVNDPVAVGAARLAAGGVALVLMALVRHGPASLAACLRRPLVGWAALAAVATAAYQSAFFSAVASTGVVTGTVVALGTAPVATGLCGTVLFGERLNRWWLGSTVLAVAGCVVLVSAGQSGAASVRPAGVALAVLAGACYGLYTSAAKALLDREVPVMVAMGVTLGAGAVLLSPVLVADGLQLIGARPLLMVGWLGLVTTAAAYLLFARGLRQLPAGTVGTLSLAEPLTAAVLGLLVLGERPAPQAAVGAVSLLAGLLLTALRPVPAARPATAHPVTARPVTARPVTDSEEAPA
jgi:DME family drug/metabolite transporter